MRVLSPLLRTLRSDFPFQCSHHFHVPLRCPEFPAVQVLHTNKPAFHHMADFFFEIECVVYASEHLGPSVAYHRNGRHHHGFQQEQRNVQRYKDGADQQRFPGFRALCGGVDNDRALCGFLV